MSMPSAEEALNFMRDAIVHQHIDLTGPWQGWRIRGQYLVSPEKERVPVRELVGLLIHYRAKFGHHRPTGRRQVQPADNVVQFVPAAVAQLQARQRKAG